MRSRYQSSGWTLYFSAASASESYTICRWRYNSTIAILLGFGLIVGGCTSTSQVSTQYYEISGSSSKALDREIRRKGPHDGKWAAMAGISIRPINLEPSVSAGLCRFRNATFRVNADITLPRWREAASSRDAELRRNWKGFAAYAQAHEAVHVKIAEAFARTLENAFLAISPQPSCSRLETVALALMRKMVPLHNQAQLDFDAREQKRIARLVAQAKREQR